MCYKITGRWEYVTKRDVAIIEEIEENGEKKIKYNWWSRFWFDLHNGRPWEILAMATAPDGKIWIAGTGGFMVYFDGENWVNVEQWCHGEICGIGSLIVAPDGSIWAVGGRYSARWDGTKWEDLGPCGNDDYHRCLFITSDGSIQAINEKGYLVCWKDNKWVDEGRWFTSDGWLIHTAVGTPDGGVWIAGLSGMTAYWDGEKWEVIDSWRCNRGSRYGSGDINNLVVSPDGIVWAGGDDGYLTYWDGSKWVNCDRWFCEEGGLMEEILELVWRYSRKDDDDYDDYDDYDENVILCDCIHGLTAAPDGSIWAASDGGCIARWVYEIENQPLK